MLAPEQTSVALTEGLVPNFSKPDDLVCEAFVGTLSTAKECLLLNKQW